LSTVIYLFSNRVDSLPHRKSAGSMAFSVGLVRRHSYAKIKHSWQVNGSSVSTIPQSVAKPCGLIPEGIATA
jgi:hypothetical protein